MTATTLESTFKDSVLNQFFSLSQTQLTEDEVDNFICYLMESKVVPEVTMRIYTVLSEFKKLACGHPEKSKTEHIETIAKRLKLNKNTISNILKDHKGKFELK